MFLGRLLSLFRGGGRPEFVLPPTSELEVTESGLLYKLLEPGNGDTPQEHDEVTVRYAGWFEDGKLFDASYPGTARFPLNRVIKGWTEGVQLLRPGGTGIFIIPGSLAYGPRGAPPRIGPNATLVFRIELVAGQ